jgi:hypothetical protein
MKGKDDCYLVCEHIYAISYLIVKLEVIGKHPTWFASGLRVTSRDLCKDLRKLDVLR